MESFKSSAENASMNEKSRKASSLNDPESSPYFSQSFSNTIMSDSCMSISEDKNGEMVISW